MNDITNDSPRLNSSFNKSERELLIENVRNWVILDQQLHDIHEKTKQIRELKTTITSNICKYMKSNHITTNIGISN